MQNHFIGGPAWRKAREALRDAGLHFDAVVADGTFQRASKPHDAQWLIANAGTTASGKPWLELSAGDLRETGGEHTATLVWKSWAKGELSRAELSEIRSTEKAHRATARLELDAKQEDARHRAMAMWCKAKPGAHPYLKRKRLPPGNTRVLGDELLIPLFTPDGWFTNVQRITPTGAKHGLDGARFAGTYHPINYYFIDEPKVYIAEGWATAAAIGKVRGVPVVAAMSGGNLLPIAAAIRKEKPDVEIVVAADNDAYTPSNPGIAMARKAAAQVGGKLIVPDFTGLPPDGKPTDFWDYFSLRGEI